MRREINKAYCYECNDYVEFVTKKVKRQVQVRDEFVDVEIYECFCSKCHEEVSNHEIERKNDIIVFDAYKKKVGLLTSAEIKAIRQKRGMSQVELARFLKIGDKDIARYESGSIQNKSIDNMIRLMDDDEAYERMLRVWYNKEESLLVRIKWSSSSFLKGYVNISNFKTYKDVWDIRSVKTKVEDNNYGKGRKNESIAIA